MIAMLPKKVNCQSGDFGSNRLEIEQSIAIAEELADKELRHMTKRHNYIIKKKREKRRKNEAN